MSNKAVYQLSARQIILLAFFAALAAVAVTSGLYFLKQSLGTADPSTITLAENAPAGISDPSAVTDEQNSIEVYKAISPGVAFINTTTYQQDFWGGVQEGKGNGSGSVIDSQGHILTNYHVVEDAQKLTVSFGGDKVYPAKYVGGDPDTDLAVIKIEPPAGGLTVVPFGDSDKLSVGQKVLAIGNPFDSGGPLLDKFGKMIGINSQILSPAGGSVGVGFAIPVNTARRVIPQLLQYGEVRRPKLGATLPSVSELRDQGYRLPVEKGLLVYQVSPGSPASTAGLRGIGNDGTVGDIIVSADGQPMDSLDDLYRLLDKKQFGETVQLEVFRDGKTIPVTVKLTPLATGTRTRRTQE